MAGILITGATGFVGSHLVESIARNGLRARALVRETSDVRTLKRYGIERVIGDLTDPASLRRAVADADTVLHLAASTRALSREEFHRVNGEGTRRLARAVAEAGGERRLVYLSSLAAAGPSGERPVRPEDEPRPVSAYGESKLAGERAVGEAALEGVSTAVLRAPAVYGPGDRDLLTFFRLADRGLLPVVGAADRRLQLVHVRDLARAILMAGSATATGIFHIAEPRAYAWDEILDLVSAVTGGAARRIRIPTVVLNGAAAVAEAVARATGRAAIFDRDKAREVVAWWLCETEAARRAFGFEAAVPLPDGLRETAEWYRSSGWLRPGRAWG